MVSTFRNRVGSKSALDTLNPITDSTTQAIVPVILPPIMFIAVI